MIKEMIGYGGIVSLTFSFIAGILTSITPCNLSSLPLLIIQFREHQTKKESILIAVLFSFGMAITFGIIGTASSIFGWFIQLHHKVWYLILGIVMLTMSFQVFGLVEIVKPTYLSSRNKTKGRFGAFISGVLTGLFSSPCSTPILVSIIALILASKNVVFSFILLVLYSLGNCITTVVIALYINKINEAKQNEKYGMIMTFLQNTLGVLVLFLGFYLVYLGI